MNSNTRLGTPHSGKGFGGNIPSTSGLPDGGFCGKRLQEGVSNKYAGYGGSPYQDGKQFYGHNGGYPPNSSDCIYEHNGQMGASLFIVAEEIDGLCLDALSTGGCGGSRGSGTLNVDDGTNGGCGYGGGGADYYISGDNAGISGAQGGVHGGGSGASNEDDSKWSAGGGSSGFCTIYCNSFTNLDTTNFIFD